jgi:hypothetical protein
LEQVGFQAEVVSAVVLVVRDIEAEVHPSLCTSIVPADSVLAHFGNKGSDPLDCQEPSLGVCLSQPSTWIALETLLPTSFLLGLWYKVF